MDTIRCTLMRGGTSKGLVLARRDVDRALASGWELDALLVELMGSYDPSQVDGLGGGRSTASKLMIVDDEPDEHGRIRYDFAQVVVSSPSVDHGGNCGNFTSAVAAYVVDEGIVEPTEPLTVARLYNTNTDTEVVAEVPTADGRSQPLGDEAIDGVTRTGGRIVTRFVDPGGGLTGATLPTGKPIDVLQTSDGEIEVTFVDVTNPLIFARARDLGITGTESSEELDADAEFLARAERVRAAGAVRLGFVDDLEDATRLSPGIPKMTLVADAGVDAALPGAELTARMMSLQKTHPTYALSGSMCTAAAALIPGTIPAEGRTFPDASDEPVEIAIQHPKGRIAVEVEAERRDGETVIGSTAVIRTARRLLAGDASLRPAPPADA